MPYLETVQELLDDGTLHSATLVLSGNKLRTNLRATCDLTRKISIQVVGGNIDMGRLTSEKYTAPQHKSNLRNIRGTFAAEGMTISKSTRSNLDRIASGQTSYQQVLNELRAKYEEPLSHLR